LPKRLKGLEPSTFCMASSAEVVLKRHELPANQALSCQSRPRVHWPQIAGNFVGLGQ
jgi:hypothetical protein